MRRPEVTEETKKNLLKIQKKRRNCFILIASFFPAGVLISEVIISPISGILVLSLFLITGICVAKVAFQKCPRCRQFFFFSPSWANGFTSKCLNCGISFKGKEERTGGGGEGT